MIKIDRHTPENLDQLAQEHWISLNPTLANGTGYWQNALKSKLEKAKADPLNTPIEKRFWNYLSDSKYRKLKQLIVSRPDILKTLINEINRFFGEKLFSKIIDQNRAELTPFGNKVLDVFNYSAYRDHEQCKQTIEKFKLGYCPYCNKDEIAVVENPDGLRLYGLIDHFYPKSRHPYLALSFFNLVPSCYTCNSQLKGHKAFDITTHVNPFHDSFDDHFEFYLDYEDLIQDQNDIRIKYRNKKGFPDSSISVFDLISRYETPVNRSIIYEGYIFFQNYATKTEASDNLQIAGLATLPPKDIYKLCGIPINAKNISNHSLGKLKRDVFTDLGFL